MKTLFASMVIFASFTAQAGEIDHAITLGSLLNPPTGCFDNINCPPGSQCLNGKCVFQGTCSSDVDCGAGRRCVRGTCR